MLKTLRAIVAALLLALPATDPARAAATLLPPGQNCFQATTGITGMVGSLGTITGGSGGTAGSYAGVSLTGGTGSGATANITVAGGAVTAVTILNPGTQYTVGDVLSAASGSIGSTTGFSVPVASVSINSSLAGGTVAFYYPNTSSFKSTWFNADQSASHQNTNPVTLDQNGCAIIYGIGSYRQVLKDSLGNTVWDAVTTDTSANNNTFWAGLAAGTPNAITVVDPGFNATDGSIINFTANATNTGPATLNPSSFGAVPILKDTTAGPVSLTGGEIIQNNPISVIYRASDNAFHILNPPIQSASGSTAPLCGAIGYKVTSNTATALDVSATSVVMVSPAGQALNRSKVALTLNFAVNGANGLDTGGLTADTAYYIYMIDNGAAPATLASLSSTTPTMPTGYTYVCRLSAAVTDGASHFPTLTTFGQETHYAATFNSYTAVGACFGGLVTQVVSHLPAVATFAVGTLFVGPVGKAAVGAGTANSEVLVDFTSVNGTEALYFRIPLPTPRTPYICASGSGQVAFYGWLDSTNAH